MHYIPGVISSNSKIVGIDNHKIIGDIDLITNNKTGYSHIGMVRNLSQGVKKGIQERMTNSAIQVNKSLLKSIHLLYKLSSINVPTLLINISTSYYWS